MFGDTGTHSAQNTLWHTDAGVPLSADHRPFHESPNAPLPPVPYGANGHLASLCLVVRA